MTRIKLYGNLGEEIGKIWNLQINSVAEGIRAIESQSHKLVRHLLDKDKEGVGYQVLVNGVEIGEQELQLNREMETIEIIPILGGGDGVIQTIAGVVLTVVGFIAPGAQFLIPLGIALVAGGIYQLIVGEVKPQDFSAQSYIFQGPTNTANQGNIIPIAYGEVIVGGQIISYEVRNKTYSDRNFSAPSNYGIYSNQRDQN